MSKRYGIVEYFGLGDGHRCGYCKGETSNVSHGMWSHALMCQDYEDLMNRGWRRSGKYVYKPLMDVTCCPQYTIRCEVADLKLTKSQKKVLKRMNNFLIFGNERRNSVGDDKLSHALEDSARGSHGLKSNSEDKALSGIVKEKSVEAVEESSGSLLNQEGATITERQKCRKAKEIRKERKRHKLEAKAALEGKTMSDVQDDLKRQPNNLEKALEDYIGMSLPSCKTKHKLEVKLTLVDMRSDDFQAYYNSGLSLFCKYQRDIHADPPAKLTERRFKRFLVDSPLEHVLPESQSDTIPSTGLGSFHQQYYLDGKLIAVGVIDILPHCVSSKYFFYDPEYDFLSLGTYSALREIYFVRSLRRSCPSMKYYYIGFYIHTCPKMVYKRQYQPSYLLCPETFQFIPIEKCLPKLDKSKYSRLADDSVESPPPGRPEHALILSQRQAMPFSLYEMMLQSASEKRKQRAEVSEYVTLTGAEVASRILLYRKAPFDSDSDD